MAFLTAHAKTHVRNVTNKLPAFTSVKLSKWDWVRNCAELLKRGARIKRYQQGGWSLRVNI